MRVVRHYASSRFVQVALVLGAAVGYLAFRFLPEAALPIAATILRNCWIPLGAIAALSIQIIMRLITVGEDRHLDGREQGKLAEIVGERQRYLVDLSVMAVAAMCVGIAAGALPPGSQYMRLLVANSVMLGFWSALLALRLHSLLTEIRRFLWRLAQEHRDAEKHQELIRDLRAAAEEDLPEIPEVVRRNGT